MSARATYLFACMRAVTDVSCFNGRCHVACVAVCHRLVVQCVAVRCRMAVQGVAGCCRVLRGVAVWCCSVLQSVAVCCSVLQSLYSNQMYRPLIVTATSPVLQSIAVCCRVLHCGVAARCKVLQRVAGCCSAWHCVAVTDTSYKNSHCHVDCVAVCSMWCCRVLQGMEVCCSIVAGYGSVLQYFAVCCRVSLQLTVAVTLPMSECVESIAVCCCVLQGVAGCCRVLQCVAVCCKV